jgi:uncharacterized protein YerC
MEYESSERKSREAVAAELGISMEGIQRLALCLRPRKDHFGIDVRAIAAHVGADAGTLARVARAAQALDAMTIGVADAERGLLLAARARAADADKGMNEESTGPVTRRSTSVSQRNSGRKRQPPRGG